MKKIFYFFTILLLAIFTQTLTTSNVGGKSSNTTSCGSCHGNTANMNTTISYTFDGSPITTYTPGKVYAVILTLANSVQTGTPKAGFTLNFSKGTLSGHNTAEAAISGTKLYHKTAKALSSGIVTYAFNWTAPVAGSGVVALGTVGNVVNGNGGDDAGDQWNYSTFNLTEQTTTIPDTAKIVISVSPSNSTKPGQSVTFTATPTNEGTAPTYQWKKNGTNIAGATSSTYTSTTLITNDKITCVLTSNLAGVVGSPATSNQITMTVKWGAGVTAQSNSNLDLLYTSTNKVFRINSDTKIQVELYNLNGSKVYSKSISSNESVDLTHLNSGTYIAKMGEVTKKLVIE